MSFDGALKAKSYFFAIRIVRLSNYLKKTYKEYDLSRQVIRSGTAVGASIREAEHAESHRDFVHKLNIGLKEINETIYWLDVLFETNFLSKNMHDSIRADAVEILRMLIASVKTAKTKGLHAEQLSSII
jgi:four helix bundle protein